MYHLACTAQPREVYRNGASVLICTCWVVEYHENVILEYFMAYSCPLRDQNILRHILLMVICSIFGMGRPFTSVLSKLGGGSAVFDVLHCFTFQTPLSWQGKWDGPEDPMQYLRGLVTRAQAIQTWVEKAESGRLLQETLDLSELFHPDTFLNALRQQTARFVAHILNK